MANHRDCKGKKVRPGDQLGVMEEGEQRKGHGLHVRMMVQDRSVNNPQNILENQVWCYTSVILAFRRLSICSESRPAYRARLSQTTTTITTTKFIILEEA
jgi:hypothetical protein